jgi:hypothetical protein
MHCHTINSFVKKNDGDDVDPLKNFNALHASCSFLYYFLFLLCL